MRLSVRLNSGWKTRRNSLRASAWRRPTSSSAALLQGGVHARLEEMVGAAAFALGAVEREVGVLQQRLGVDAVARRDRDADAGADDDVVAVDLERLGHRA